jgi:hypothetical protein
MKPLLSLLLAAWFLAIPGIAPADAQSLDDRFDEANGSYHRGEWAQAIEQYAVIREQFGTHTAALSYNLGTAHARAGQSGKAILEFERARLLDPPDALSMDIQANLATVRSSLAEEHRRSSGEELYSFGNAQPVWARFFQSMPASTLRWSFAGALALLILLWMGYRTTRSTGRALGVLLTFTVGLTLISGTMTLGNHWTAEQVTVGIIVGARAQIREGLHDQAESQIVPEGLSVRILEGSMQRDHLRVQLTNGREGWMAVEDIEEI